MDQHDRLAERRTVTAHMQLRAVVRRHRRRGVGYPRLPKQALSAAFGVETRP